MPRFALLCASAFAIVGCTVGNEPVALRDPLSLIPKPPPPSEFRVVVLASPDTVNSYARSINATGTMVGTIELSQSGSQFAGVVWDTTGIPTQLRGGVGMTPADISDYGEIVANRGGRTWVYFTPVKRALLPLPLGVSAASGAANNWQGTVVGTMSDATGLRTAVRWIRIAANQWTVSALPVSSKWAEGGACDINALGDISGWVRDSSGTYHAWVWLSNGLQYDIGEIASLDGLRINNKQQLLLHAYGVGGTAEVRIVHAPTGAQEPTAVFPQGTLMNALNDAGRIVGVAPVSIRHGAGFTNVPVTQLLHSGRPADDLPFSASANVLPGGHAFDVNLCGTVAGSLRSPRNGFQRAVEWQRVNGDCDPDAAPVLRVSR